MWDVTRKQHGALCAVQLTLYTLLACGSSRKPGTSSPGLTTFGKPDGWTIPIAPGGRSGGGGGPTQRAALTWFGDGALLGSDLGEDDAVEHPGRDAGDALKHPEALVEP